MILPGCFVASISDELYRPILNADHLQPSSQENLDHLENINHQPT